MTVFLRIPQENPNDDVAFVAEWRAPLDRPMAKEEVLCVLETTKSTFEFEAPVAGYLRPLVGLHQEVSVGTIFAALTETADEPVDVPTETASQEVEPATTSHVRVTKKAELIAQRLGVDLQLVIAAHADLETIGESEVREFAEGTKSVTGPVSLIPPTAAVQRVVVVGGGDGATQVLDAMSRIPHLHPVGILDDSAELHGRSILGVPVLGSVELAKDLFDNGKADGAIISMGSSVAVRVLVHDRLASMNVPLVNVIDPSVLIGLDVSMGTGNFISAGARIGPSVTIGDNNFLSSFVSIEHHNILGSHCAFGPGVMMSGRVHVGDRCRFGTGIFVQPHVEIGEDCVIASGLALVSHVAAHSIVKAKNQTIVRTRESSS